MTAGVPLVRTEERLKVVKRMDEAGATAAEIAAKLGVTTRTIQRLRTRLRGEPGEYHPPLTPEQLQLFDQLLTDGWSYKEICRTHHVAEGTLSARFPGRGWTRQQSGKMSHAGRIMNNLKDHAMPVHVTSFAAIKPARYTALRDRPAYLAGQHVNELRKVG